MLRSWTPLPLQAAPAAATPRPRSHRGCRRPHRRSLCPSSPTAAATSPRTRSWPAWRCRPRRRSTCRSTPGAPMPASCSTPADVDLHAQSIASLPACTLVVLLSFTAALFFLCVITSMHACKEQRHATTAACVCYMSMSVLSVHSWDERLVAIQDYYGSTGPVMPFHYLNPGAYVSNVTFWLKALADYQAGKVHTAPAFALCRMQYPASCCHACALRAPGNAESYGMRRHPSWSSMVRRRLTAPPAALVSLPGPTASVLSPHQNLQRCAGLHCSVSCLMHALTGEL